MALHPKMQVTLTIEEIEDIKETAGQRADELEWQLRVELAKIREVERNLSRLLGEASQVPAEVAATAPPSIGRGTPSYGTPLPPEAKAHIAAPVARPSIAPPPISKTSTTSGSAVQRAPATPPPLPTNVHRLNPPRKP